MDIEDLIALALELPDTRQSGNVETPDFRVAGKIFATLPSNVHLVLKLTLEQQEMVIQSDPKIFAPVEDAWGERGWTNATISTLDEASALSSLIMAWGNVAPKSIRGGAIADDAAPLENNA